jgi:hypothetical protein
MSLLKNYLEKLRFLEIKNEHYEKRGLDLIDKESGNIVLKYRKVFIGKLTIKNINLKRYNNFFEIENREDRTRIILILKKIK